MRVIADHARTTAFLVAEGVFPDRAAREYVLRRVMRARDPPRASPRHPRAVPSRGRRRGGAPHGRRSTRSSASGATHRRACTEQEEVRFRETHRPRPEDPRRRDRVDEGARRCDARRRRRVQAVRHVRLPARSHRGDLRASADSRSTRPATRSTSRSSARAAKDRRSARRPSRTYGASALEKVPSGACVFTGYEREEGEGKVVAIVKGARPRRSATAGEEVERRARRDAVLR